MAEWMPLHDVTGLVIAEGIVADGLLIDAPAPLGRLWVPLHSGLTVLYGRNGAGKTRLLEALTRALQGVGLDEGEVSLHLSFPPASGRWDSELLERICDWVGGASRYSTGDFFRTFGIDKEEMRNMGASEDTLRRLGCGDPAAASELSPTEDSDEVGANETSPAITADGMAELVRGAIESDFGLEDGRCHTPRVALAAVGTCDSPAWEVHLSVVPTDRLQFWNDQFRPIDDETAGILIILGRIHAGAPGNEAKHDHGNVRHPPPAALRISIEHFVHHCRSRTSRDHASMVDHTTTKFAD